MISCSKKIDEIKLFPGQGITIGGDSILLETSPKSFTEHFNIKKDSINNEGVHWDGYDTEGNEVSGYYEIERVHFKGIEFEFTGLAIDSLSLTNILINTAVSVSRVDLDNIDIRQNTLEILKKFPNTDRTEISPENMSEYGILFQIDTINKKSTISRVSIHSKKKSIK
jgi:hypothetical protein